MHLDKFISSSLEILILRLLVFVDRAGVNFTSSIINEKEDLSNFLFKYLFIHTLISPLSHSLITSNSKKIVACRIVNLCIVNILNNINNISTIKIRVLHSASTCSYIIFGRLMCLKITNKTFSKLKILFFQK